MRFLSLPELAGKLLDYDTKIDINSEVELFWKRWFEYSCKDRTLDQQEFSYIIRGNIWGSISGEKINLGPGDFFWIQPNTKHSLTWNRDLIYYTLRFSISQADEDLTIKNSLYIFHDVYRLESFMKGLTDCIRNRSGSDLYEGQIKAYLYLIISELNEMLSKTKDSQVRIFTSQQINLIQNYLKTGDGCPTTDCDKLAAALGLSKSYFSRLFRNTFKKTFRKYVFEEKIGFAARHLVDTDLSISEMAELVGYNDEYLFSRQFKKVIGCSPTTYRNEYKWIMNRET